MAEVRVLLAGGADIRAEGGHRGETALHLAGQKDHAAVVEALLAEGADVHVKNDRGWTALHSASREGHVAVMEALLAGGVDVHAKDNSRMTALHYAGHCPRLLRT